MGYLKYYYEYAKWMNYRRPAAVLIANFLGPLAGNMVLALVPTLKEEFQATAPEVLLSITFFMIPFAIFMLFSGTLSDIYDRKKTMAVGFFIYAVGSICCGLSPNLSVFLAFRTVQGVGYSFVMPVLLAIMGDITPFEVRGRWMGYMGAASTAGVAAGPFFAGVIAEVNWRLAFVLVAGLTVIVATIFFLAFRGYSFKRGEARPSAVISMISKCIRSQAIYLLAFAGFLTFLCYASSLSFISDTLSLPPLDLSDAEIGTIMTATGIAGIFSAPIGGRLVDRVGRKPTATLGFAVLIIGMAILYFSNRSLDFVAGLAVLGSGVQLVWSALLTLTVEISPDNRGTVSSIFNSFRFFGYALAPVALAPVYVSLGIGAVELVGILIAIIAIAIVIMIKTGATRSLNEGPSG
jgi:ACDE family multidrug resistance protein